jgi:transcriptional regulator with XRE-family HTH domain
MTSPTNIKGGKHLASLRQAIKLTQSELAERAGISRSMIAQLESGERRPSRKMLYILCRALSATKEEEQQLLAAYEFLPSGQTPEQIAALLRADKNLTPEQVEQISNLVREAYEKALSE